MGGQWLDRDKKRGSLQKGGLSLKEKNGPNLPFEWVKGHNGVCGNEECDRLVKEGARKAAPDNLNLDIPRKFDLLGAKLATLSQAIAYRGI